MTQDPNDNSSFTVAAGEQATVTLQAVQCNCNTSAAFDGSAVGTQSSDPDVYVFSIAGVSGNGKVFAASCEFLSGDPVTAHYSVQVSGGAGGAFESSSVFMQLPKAEFQLFFTIA
jgi:hypothetical protein